VRKCKFPCVYGYNRSVTMAAAFRSRKNRVWFKRAYERYYRRFIDTSRRRAVAKSFELSQKRHFWPASKSRARAPPKTSSGDGGGSYVGTHIVYIQFYTYILQSYTETWQTANSATHLPRTIVSSLSLIAGSSLLCALAQSCRLTTTNTKHTHTWTWSVSVFLLVRWFIFFRWR